MAALLKGFIALTFILLTIDYGYGDPRVCYACLTTNTGDNKPCNDPVDTNAIDIVDCLLVTKKNSTDGPPVCAKASYVLNGNITTLRSCAPKTVNGNDLCSLVKKNFQTDVIGQNITDFKCSTCNSDLCNTSTSIYASVLFLAITNFIRLLI